VFAVQGFHHGVLVHSQQFALCHRHRGSHTNNLACERAFTKETPFRQYADRRFLARFGHDGEPHLAGLNIKDGVRSIALGEDHLLLRGRQEPSTLANRRQESDGVEFARLVRSCG